MTSSLRIVLATLVLAAAQTGCVDAKCPAGSKSVDGICRTVDAGGLEGAQDGGGLEGQAGVGGGPPSGDAGAQDAGDAGVDAAPPTLGCSDLPCDEHARCDDASGTVVCTCDQGYEGDGLSCSDVDECDDGSHDCHDDAECTNEPGGYTCECKPGFEGDGEECEANPCEPRVNPCDEDTTACRDDDGEAVCDCVEGRGRCEDDPHSCETDLLADEDHCGACEAACAGNLSCDEGECEQRVVQLELGTNHSCALATDGEILCWGMNDTGQLARDEASVLPTYEPAPTELGPARALSAGADVSCAILEADDELVCFGYNVLSWIESGPSEGTFSVATGLTNTELVEVGVAHACLLTEQTVYGWGFNGSGLLGDSGVGMVAFGGRVERAEEVSRLAAGAVDCVIGTDARVRCWGNSVDTPTEIVDGTDDPIEGATDISVAIASSTSCAVLDDGRAVCWGGNQSGQLGNVGVSASSSAFAVPVTDESGTAISQVVEIAVGNDFACARHEDGRVLCWGRRDRLGSGAAGTAAQRFATEVSDVDDAVEIAAGGTHACARRRSGQVQCWGSNANGQLGVNPGGGSGISYATSPVDIIGLP